MLFSKGKKNLKLKMFIESLILSLKQIMRFLVRLAYYFRLIIENVKHNTLHLTKYFQDIHL